MWSNLSDLSNLSNLSSLSNLSDVQGILYIYMSMLKWIVPVHRKSEEYLYIYKRDVIYTKV